MAKRQRKAKLLEDQYPTHYLPNVGRQVMQEGGMPHGLSEEDKRALSHERGMSGVVEFAPVGVTEPLSGTRLPLGSLPKETAQFAEPALQAASEIAPYFTPAAPIAAARDVAAGLKHGDPSEVGLAALGLPGRAAKAAAIAASAFMPSEAEAGIVDRVLQAIRSHAESNDKKISKDNGGPVKNIPRADDEDFFRRLALWTYAVSPLFSPTSKLGQKRLGYDKGGVIKKALEAASKIASKEEPLFDFSRLKETPKVPQFDLPRYEPPRGVPARVEELSQNKEVMDKMMEVINRGKEASAAEWYNTEPLRERFISELGVSAGQPAFRKYMDLIAATSPRSDVGTNVRNASYYYGKLMRGEDLPAVGERNPAPYGHLAQKAHQKNVISVAGPGWDPLENPKPASFVENLSGNWLPATVDTHALRLPAILSQDPRFLETAYKPSKDVVPVNFRKMLESGEKSMDELAAMPVAWQAFPKPNEYGALEQYYKKLAQEAGMSPAETQAAAWVGGGKQTGLKSDESKPFLGFFQDRIYKTARELNMDPNDVLNSFIRGKTSLYKDGGSVIDRALDVVSNILHEQKKRDAA